jgi:hypothetical protein
MKDSSPGKLRATVRQVYEDATISHSLGASSEHRINNFRVFKGRPDLGRKPGSAFYIIDNKLYSYRRGGTVRQLYVPQIGGIELSMDQRPSPFGGHLGRGERAWFEYLAPRESNEMCATDCDLSVC